MMSVVSLNHNRVGGFTWSVMATAVSIASAFHSYAALLVCGGGFPWKMMMTVVFHES